MYYKMPEWLCSIASGFFAISSWPLLYRFLSRFTQVVLNTVCSCRLFESSVSEHSNVFVFDHHRSVLPWLLLPVCETWKGQICQSLTVQQGATFCVPHCFPGAARRVIRHLSFRGTSKMWMWLFLNLNYLSKTQLCWSLCCFGRAGHAPGW